MFQTIKQPPPASQSRKSFDECWFTARDNPIHVPQSAQSIQLNSIIVLLHTVAPVLKWDISATVTLNESTNGSCLVSGNPCPLAEVHFLHDNCEYSSKPITVNDFTTKVEFTIHRVTEDCKVVFCITPNHLDPNYSMSLNITGKPDLH